VAHGAEHVVSLFFSTLNLISYVHISCTASCSQVHEFQIISQFAKKCRNIWGSVRHKPSAMFKKYSAEHNNSRSIGFIKPSECRMAGEHIALLCLLRLCSALKATVTSKEFIDLKAFKDASEIVMMDDFWSYVFVLCRTLYAPMQVLCLADQKTPAMDKLYFYTLQTDIMLPKYLSELEKQSNNFLSTTMARVMGNIQSAGDSSGSHNDEDDEDRSEESSTYYDNEDKDDARCVVCICFIFFHELITTNGSSCVISNLW
jgi:hypothetical protein